MNDDNYQANILRRNQHEKMTANSKLNEWCVGLIGGLFGLAIAVGIIQIIRMLVIAARSV